MTVTSRNKSLYGQNISLSLFIRLNIELLVYTFKELHLLGDVDFTKITLDPDEEIQGY